MRGVLYTRWLRLRKDWKSHFIWLLLPILLTFLTTQLIGIWSEGTKIPIGLVVEKETNLSNQLIEKLKSVSYLDVKLLNEREAMNELEKHELDSVFVLHDRYEEIIMDGKRNGLVESYSSNRSYAYFAVKELVTSYVQDDVLRMRAAYEVRDLFREYGTNEEWNWEEIVEVSVEKQESQQLLQTSFSYQNHSVEVTEDNVLPVFNIWGIWAFFSLISTFFIFDWVLKEKRPDLHIRWYFTSINFKKFASMSFIFYTVLLLIVDGLTLYLLSKLLQQPLTFDLCTAILFYKLVVHLLAFLFVNLFTQSLMYYVSSIGLTLVLTLLSGAIIPIDGLVKEWTWVENLSPITALLQGKIPYDWIFILSGWFCIWYWKGDK